MNSDALTRTRQKLPQRRCLTRLPRSRFSFIAWAANYFSRGMVCEKVMDGKSPILVISENANIDKIKMMH